MHAFRHRRHDHPQRPPVDLTKDWRIGVRLLCAKGLHHHDAFTYFIAIGGFAHVVVGSGEAAYAVLMGDSSVYDYFFRFLIPTGLGNIIGGTGIFTLLVSAQVKVERK